MSPSAHSAEEADSTDPWDQAYRSAVLDHVGRKEIIDDVRTTSIALQDCAKQTLHRLLTMDLSLTQVYQQHSSAMIAMVQASSHTQAHSHEREQGRFLFNMRRIVYFITATRLQAARSRRHVLATAAALLESVNPTPRESALNRACENLSAAAAAFGEATRNNTVPVTSSRWRDLYDDVGEAIAMLIREVRRSAARVGLDGI
jgi:hypothetical protein